MSAVTLKLEMSLTQARHLLRAALVGVARDEARPALDYVFFETDGDLMRIVSSNGHYLCCLSGPKAEVHLDGADSVLLPGTLLRRALRSIRENAQSIAPTSRVEFTAFPKRAGAKKDAFSPLAKQSFSSRVVFGEALDIKQTIDLDLFHESFPLSKWRGAVKARPAPIDGPLEVDLSPLYLERISRFFGHLNATSARLTMNAPYVGESYCNPLRFDSGYCHEAPRWRGSMWLMGQRQGSASLDVTPGVLP